MEKLNLRPSKPARIVYQTNGDWYVLWYSNSKRYRQKFGLNYIKDLALRQRWADRILEYINSKILSQQIVTEEDIPSSLQPSPFVENHSFLEIVKEPKKSTTFFEYWQFFTKMKEAEGLSVSWTDKFHTLLNLMRKFADTEGVKDFEFSQIDRSWVSKFKSFCIKPPYQHSINNLSKNLKIIRQVLKDADVEADDIEVNPKYKSDSFKLKEVKTDEIALTIDEVRKIYDVVLTDYPIGYTIVRDNFIVGCLTALRWSDWEIKPENLIWLRDGEKSRAILKIITQKTNDVVLIPVHPLAHSILEKYAFNLPTISNQNSNEYLKVIARLAGLDEIVQLRRSKAGKVMNIKPKKYEQEKTHTARRTFVTIALTELNMPSTIVMKITGHKTERQLFEYARISSEKAAMIMAKAMEGYLKGT